MENRRILELTNSIAEKAALFEDYAGFGLFLQEVVDLTREYTGSSATAVFLYEEEEEQLVFKAGSPVAKFNDPESLRFGLDENIAGRAFSGGTIINEQGQDAEGGDGSVLAVPILHGPDTIGVLAFAHPHPEYFSRSNENDLRALASQFGSILQDTSLLLRTGKSGDDVAPEIYGLTASAGTASGIALQFEVGFELVQSTQPHSVHKDDELGRFDVSLDRTLRQLEDLKENEDSPIHDMASLIFTSYILMLKDQSFTGRMRSYIENGQAAEPAIRSVVTEYIGIFARMKEARLAEKAQDVRDLGYRLIRNLDDSGDDETDYRGQIAVARHIYPSDLVRLSIQNVNGIVLTGGGLTAHLSILARTLGLPVMLTNDRSILDIVPGSLIALDATNAVLYTRPDSDLVAAMGAESELHDDTVSPTAAGVTKDGERITIYGNVNLYSDAREAARRGAEGIGLYRSEFPFIINNDFLTEDQQYEIYRKIIESMPGKPVILRTADIGGDKLLAGRDDGEANPFLGVRGIRFSLANRKMFREQIRGMLRAGEGADLGIMLPMVSSVEEVIEAKEEISNCIQALQDEGYPCNDSPKIGAMIELPSAAVSVPDLAEETDFLSIGTNDLVMYLLAVDRTNEKLSDLYQSYHPTVLRTLAYIADTSGESINNLSVCGDSASDPLVIPFLIGIGVRKLSVAPDRIDAVKEFLLGFTVTEAVSIAEDMLKIRRRMEMEDYLNRIRDLYPSGMLENGLKVEVT